MTDRPTHEVTEADREIYIQAQYDALDCGYAEQVRSGGWNDVPGLRLIARHRAQAVAEALAARDAEVWIYPTCDGYLKTISRACYELQLHLG